MKIQQFFQHHGIIANPFADEDAQIDSIFKEHCIDRTYHPSWDKIFGEPSEPGTAIVFGEKGAGKTAMRLQIARHLAEHNRAHPERRLFVIEYDDFNPYLDRFRESLRARSRRTDRALSEWKLWDHMDAILSLGITQLVDRILATPREASSSHTETGEPKIDALDRLQKRDLLMLAACYDRSWGAPFKPRMNRLRRSLRYFTWPVRRDFLVGVAVTAAGAAFIVWLQKWEWLATPWPFLALLAGWFLWLWSVARWYREAWGIARQVRVIDHETNALRQVLMRMPEEALAGQPLPNRERSDDRFELLAKLQGALKTLGYSGIIVLVDRVDEPHLINGSAEQMRAFVWPMLDNKFLKHPGLGIKLLLPIELARFVERENRDFYQRARLDKQNMVPSLLWTGEALYDVANDRLRACAADGRAPKLRDLFDGSIDDRRLIESLRTLRVPRHLFKFLYRLLVAHTSAHTDDEPVWQVNRATFESTLALYQRDQDAFDRGVGAG